MIAAMHCITEAPGEVKLRHFHDKEALANAPSRNTKGWVNDTRGEEQKQHLCSFSLSPSLFRVDMCVRPHTHARTHAHTHTHAREEQSPDRCRNEANL